MACKGCGEAGGHHKPGCGFSPTVLQITNKDCTLFHNVTIPAIMGDETEVPPTNGLYKNVLLYYEASGNAYFYSSDGIPTKLTYATTDYNALTNKPTINGVTLEGNQSSSSLGININDATLTIKQGDTTLGTFSANASENVEINLESPIRLSVELADTPTWSNGGALGPLFYYGQGALSSNPLANCIRVHEYYSTSSVNFRNEDTNDAVPIEDVFSLLESGKNIIFNNIPTVYYDARTNTYYVGEFKANGVRLSQTETFSDEGFRSSWYIGAVAMVVASPDGLATQQDRAYQFVGRFGIIKDVHSPTDIEYHMSVDGIYDSIVAD